MVCILGGLRKASVALLEFVGTCVSNYGGGSREGGGGGPTFSADLARSFLIKVCKKTDGKIRFYVC